MQSDFKNHTLIITKCNLGISNKKTYDLWLVDALIDNNCRKIVESNFYPICPRVRLGSTFEKSKLEPL